MTAVDLEPIATGLGVDPALLEYRLEPSGPALYPRIAPHCFYCTQSHPAGLPEPGNACPVRFVTAVK